MIKLDGTVSIVTGGGRGIGRAVACSLAAAGSAVALLARSESELQETAALIESAGGRAAFWSLDVTNGEQVDAAVAEIEDSLGPITLLVNNAGVNGGMGPLWLTDPAVWWQTMEVNVRGPFLCSAAVLARMVERQSGRIINMASNAGIQPTPFACAYATSKAALLRLTDCLAGEVAGLGIQVFAISPGWVWTAMTESAVVAIRKNVPDFTGIDESDVSQPEEAGALVVRLAQGEADVLSGRYIHVNDDLDGMLADAERIVAEDLLGLRLGEWRPERDA